MDIRGKINLFVATKEKDGNKFRVFNGTLSTKQKDETYLNYAIDVRFDSKNFPEEKLNKLSEDKYYVLDVKEGFIGVRSYKLEDKEIKTLYLQVLKADIVDSRELKQVKDKDLPW